MLLHCARAPYTFRTRVSHDRPAQVRATGLSERNLPQQSRWTHPANPVRVSGAAGALSPRADSGHGGLLRLGALRRKERREKEPDGGGEERHECAPGAAGTKSETRPGWRGYGPLLRRRAPPRPHADQMVHPDSRPPAPLRRHHRRRSRHHGSGQPGRARSRRQDHRIEHCAAFRAESQHLRHALAELPVSLFLHA